MGIRDNLYHAWNALKGNSSSQTPWDIGPGTYSNQSRVILPRFNSDAYTASIFNRIAVDASQVDLRHVKIDKNTGNEKDMKSKINYVLDTEANIDQSSREFIHDIVYSLMDEGHIAIVPIDTTTNIKTGSFDVETMRVGRITQWYPKHVRVEVYNEETGLKEEVVLPKRSTPIIENPLWAIVNGENSTLKRLISKLKLLDMMDNKEAQGKLDLILQLPYQIKSPLKRKEADKRLKDIEEQLANGKYGITYIDGTEKITQLNRAVTSNILEEVQSLRKEFYNQLGLTENVFNGTASEAEMRNYYSRSIDPILSRIVSEFKRKLLTKTAITQGQTFTFRRDPFKLVPIEQIAEIADKFRRNEVLSANELRSIIGYGPNEEPKADELVNPNIADVNQEPGSLTSPDESSQNGGNLQTEVEPDEV